MDKKIKELMKVCDVIELKSPTKVQMNNIINQVIPSIDEAIKPNIVNLKSVLKFRSDVVARENGRAARDVSVGELGARSVRHLRGWGVLKKGGRFSSIL